MSLRVGTRVPVRNGHGPAGGTDGSSRALGRQPGLSPCGGVRGHQARFWTQAFC